MFRALVHGIAILHLGPGLAFAVLAFGCGDAPRLGRLCGASEIQSFLVLTALCWAMLAVASWVLLRRPRREGDVASGPDTAQARAPGTPEARVTTPDRP